MQSDTGRGRVTFRVWDSVLNTGQHYQDRSPALEPGDEFGVADEFAEIVGLAGRYEWCMDPFGAGKGLAA